MPATNNHIHVRPGDYIEGHTSTNSFDQRPYATVVIGDASGSSQTLHFTQLEGIRDLIAAATRVYGELAAAQGFEVTA